MVGDAPDGPIRWRIHLPVPPSEVFRALATDAGRASFWAETTEGPDGISFRFPNGVEHRGRVVESRPPELFAFEYFGGIATFELEPDGEGGTDLSLTHTGQTGTEWHEVHAGWLNVLFPLKAMLAHGVDLRNHDPERTWDDGYADG